MVEVCRKLYGHENKKANNSHTSNIFTLIPQDIKRENAIKEVQLATKPSSDYRLDLITMLVIKCHLNDLEMFQICYTL